MEILLVLIILAVAILLYATEWLRMDLVSMLLLVTLATTGLVSVEEAFSGFSNPAVITVVAMFVLSAAIANTGLSGRFGEKLLSLGGGNEVRMIFVLMIGVAISSAFVNNIGATAVLMPVVVNMARKMRISPSKLLIPLAFGSLFGGLCTLIGTPPNILMSELLFEYTGESFRFFDFGPVGVTLTGIGILYMALIGHRLIPTRKSGVLTEAYQVKEYITEVEILPESPLDGKTISGSSLEKDLGLKVRAILRNRKKIPFPRRNRKIYCGDILFLEGNPEGILKIMQSRGLSLIPERDNPTSRPPDEELVVVEASLTPRSSIVGQTLRELRFNDAYGLTVLAIWRQGAPVVKKVDHVILRFGDVLLLQGTEKRIMTLGKSQDFLLLGGVPPVSFQPHRAPFALGVMALVVLLAALGTFPIILTATAGALILVLFGFLTPKQAYGSIDWKVILLIAGTLPLGTALERSGAARLLADGMVDLIGPFGPFFMLSALFLVTMLLTAVISNAATAVLLAPIAYNIALDMAVSPKPFFLAIAMAASACFLTPISHQSNALVMGPGGYKFIDYARVGAPLSLAIWLAGSLLIPLLFPF